MSNKLIVVMVDGLRDDAARENLGYLERLVDAKKAARGQVQSELPSLSRPLYEVLLTGTLSFDNGITSNHSVRLSKEESLFHLTKKAGLINATASYYWVSELYNRAPFNYLMDREQANRDKPIQFGKFYFEDHYPDSHLLLDGEVLRKRVNPDFLYIHSMNVDDAGHQFGSDSKEYRGNVLKTDQYLSELIPGWLEQDYQVVITSDHGMSEWGLHGGTTAGERMVPCYVISTKVKAERYSSVIPQLQMAPFFCHLLGIPKGEKMQELSDAVTVMLKG